MAVIEVSQSCLRASGCCNGAAPMPTPPVNAQRRGVRLSTERVHGPFMAQQAPQTMSPHPDALRRAEERRLRRESLALEPVPLKEVPQSPVPWYLGDHPGNMVQTQTVEDLEREVQGSDKLVVVEFFVPACPGCRKLFPKIKQIAANNSDVKFVQVNADPANVELHTHVKELGVQVLPYFALYKRGHCVSHFAATLKRVDMIRAEIAANKDQVTRQPAHLGEVL